MIAALLVVAALAAQAQPTPKPDLPILKAGLGPCAADFTVKDMDGKPLYLAMIHVRVRYGVMSVKRMDLEVGTNSEGQARIEGLPSKAKPLLYEIRLDTKRSTAEQDVASRCQATFDVTLK
jgi:hypothetical protein